MNKDNKKKVLIVEDDKDFLSILEIKFISEGFAVVTADNGEAGVIVAEKEKPDLILSDLLMPRMDGLEMAKKIRETNKKVSIIFLTNIKDPSYTDGMKEFGELKYLVKADLHIGDIVEKAKAELGI